SGSDTPTDFTIERCEFRDTSSILNFAILVKGNATANSFDGLNLRNNVAYGLGTTTGTTFLDINATADHVRLFDNQITMAALSSTAALAVCASNNMADLHVARNIIFRPSTVTANGAMLSNGGTCTGLVYDNYVQHKDTDTPAIHTQTGTGLGFIENYCILDYAADKSGALNPAFS
ncbi:hypothetical protein LCGC14_2636480, partial [marine sediment metagenome]